jgi:hypothetical protein
MAIFRPLIVSPGLSWLSAGDERSFASGRKGPDGVGADGVGCLGVPKGAILIPVWAETASAVQSRQPGGGSVAPIQRSHSRVARR